MLPERHRIMADQAAGLLSPWLRRERIKAAEPYIKGKVLDFGCGVGTLSEVCLPEFYLGIDIDEESLKIARQNHVDYRFEKQCPEGEQFDTIALIAVIEHIKNPELFLNQMKLLLKPKGRIVLTTPHPLVEKVHFCGAQFGLFSKHASEEHEQFFNYGRMRKYASLTGLKIYSYRRFLLGVNQLFVLGI